MIDFKNYGLSKLERLKRKNDFIIVYSQGKTIHSVSKKFKATFFIKNELSRFGYKAAFAVSKKAGNAVWRNRVKRLLREAFRLNKKMLLKENTARNNTLLLVLSPLYLNQKDCPKITLNEVMPDIKELLQKIRPAI